MPHKNTLRHIDPDTHSYIDIYDHESEKFTRLFAIISIVFTAAATQHQQPSISSNNKCCSWWWCCYDHAHSPIQIPKALHFPGQSCTILQQFSFYWCELHSPLHRSLMLLLLLLLLQRQQKQKQQISCISSTHFYFTFVCVMYFRLSAKNLWKTFENVFAIKVPATQTKSFEQNGVYLVYIRHLTPFAELGLKWAYNCS